MVAHYVTTSNLSICHCYGISKIIYNCVTSLIMIYTHIAATHTKLNSTTKNATRHSDSTVLYKFLLLKPQQP